MWKFSNLGRALKSTLIWRLEYVSKLIKMFSSLGSILKLPGKIMGLILIVVSTVLFFYASDIFREIFIRPLAEIDFSRLVLPVILIIIGFYLLFKKKKNDVQKKSD